MATVDYSKFKVEIFSTTGTLIKAASINSNFNFFCSGLVPNTEYNIVFTYDGALLLCAAYTCENTGKVIYLNPAHFIYNNSMETPTDAFINKITAYIDKRDTMNIPFQQWEKITLVRIANTSNKHKSISASTKKVVRFKAGNDLAGKVR
jgi:nucleoid DNA-binding protein